jgi:surface antigen
MKVIILKFVAISLVISMLYGCAGHKEGAGTAIGALAGGLLGSRFGKGSGNLAMMGVGALAGGFLGNRIGKSMDDTDKMMLEQTSKAALENAASGSTVAWRNPDNGHKGYVTPTNVFKNNVGEYCREYTQVVIVGGKEEKAYGKACRKPDGQWQIIDQ